MVIHISKKNLIIPVVVIIFVFILYLLYSIWSNKKYSNYATEMKINTKLICFFSQKILSDYSKSWMYAIDGNNVLNENGESVRCNDFNTAISWRYSYYEKEGMFQILDSLFDEIKSEMGKMTPPPSKYKAIHSNFTEMYNNVSSLVSMCKSPQGNYQEFNDRCYNLLSSLSSENGTTDLTFKGSSDSIVMKRLVNISSQIASPEEKAKAILEKVVQPNKIAGEKFLSENKKKKGITTLPDGLQYKILKRGHGRIPKANNQVTISYRGYFIDGQKFDGKQSLTLKPSQVIKGLGEILIMMPVGSKWIVYIPQNLAFGNQEQGPIKPYSTLIFEIGLLKCR